jgi:hypothetical protein
MMLFRLERLDVSNYIIDVLLPGRVANRIELLETRPPHGHV